MKYICNFCLAAAALNVLDRLTLSEVKSAGPFLDGCNVNIFLIFKVISILHFFFLSFLILHGLCILQIYLAGFAVNVRDKLNRILNVGGATRLDEISDAVTHVIVGDENKASAELKAMKARGLWYTNYKQISIFIPYLHSRL